MKEQILIFIFCFICMKLGAEVSKEETIALSISVQVSEALKNKYHLHFVGSQISGPQDKIEMMRMIFQTKRSLTKEEARKLIVESTKEYLKAINNDPEIQKYLCCLPYPVEHVEINIFIHDEKGDLVNYPNLSIVSSRQGKVEYEKWAPKNEWQDEVFLDTESYEEALKIVNAS